MTDMFSLSSQSKEVGVQLQEDLLKVLNELYSVRGTTSCTLGICESIIMCCDVFRLV